MALRAASSGLITAASSGRSSINSSVRTPKTLRSLAAGLALLGVVQASAWVFAGFAPG